MISVLDMIFQSTHSLKHLKSQSTKLSRTQKRLNANKKHLQEDAVRMDVLGLLVSGAVGDS